MFIKDYFNFKMDIFWQSRDIKTINSSSNLQKDEWAIEITKYCKKNQYINPVGGINLFDLKKFEKNKISLYSLQPHLKNYNITNPPINFSILDTIANLGYLKTRSFTKKGVIKLIQK